MLKFVRFLRMLALVFVGVLGAFQIAPAAACTSDEITLSDNSCVPVKFTMRVASDDPVAGFEFEFYIAAAGTAYIDWDDGYVQTKTTTTTASSISRRLYKTSTIRIGGNFTEYNSNNYATSATFRIDDGTNNRSYLRGISGSLGALFPSINGGTTKSTQPMFYRAFKGCTNLLGPIPPELFNGISGPARQYMFTEMFSGCTKLNGYIPYNLFSSDLTGVSSANMNYMFNNDPALATKTTGCPTGTTYVQSSYESFWSNRIACQPDTPSCDHAYNGACPDLCSFGSALKTSTGLSFPLYATKVTTVAINIQQNGVTCYVPLEAGNGGSGSLNLTYNNTTYHAGVIDVN